MMGFRAAGSVRPRTALPVFAMLAVLGLGGCATQQELVASKEDSLAAAGFVVRPANTPARQTMLSKLPPHRFVRRVRGDTVDYVYADPLVCDCLYVGSQQAYGQFQRHVQEQNLADQQEMTAQDFSDPAWNWGAWGPWGGGVGFGYGGGFGFGPGIGW